MVKMAVRSPNDSCCRRPRQRGRGVESDHVALERDRLDAVIAGLLFMAGMRRSEVSALRWADAVDSTDGLRLHAARTACARTQVMWLRDRLLKLSVHVVSSVRRLVLHLPRSTPNLDAWRKIALSLGARAG